MQPFNALTLFTSMLKKKVEGRELTELANHIDDSLNVVEALLSDLVEISRLDSSSQPPELTDFAVEELLTPLNNEFTVLAEQAGIGFHYQDSRCAIRSDKRMLRRILQNFLSNAVHYCNDKAAGENKIVLGVRRTKDQLRIEVWDNGPGIPPDKQQSIFEEFERLEQNREVPGLGLGLAISERFATRLGLSIKLVSSLGYGTGFMIEVPRVTLEQSASESTKPITQASPTSKAEDGFDISVVLIDNDPLMLTAMCSQLQDWGCRVIAAKDPEMLDQQVAKLTVPPQLIIADYHLDDDKNGVDVVQKMLAEKDWQVPCVVCSADPSEQVREHTSSAQFSFLRKPVKSLALKRLIKQILQR